MKTPRRVKLFPASFIFRLASRARRRNHCEGNSLFVLSVQQPCNCDPEEFFAYDSPPPRLLPGSLITDQCRFWPWRKTSMDEAPESDEASLMAQILAWASLWALK